MRPRLLTEARADRYLGSISSCQSLLARRTRRTVDDIVARANGYSGWKPRSFLAELPAASRQSLLNAGTGRDFPAGHTFIHEGGPDTVVYMLLSGAVKVTCAAERAEEGTALLAIRVAGDIVGELAAVDGGPRTATVTTAGAVRVREIASQTFRDLRAADPVLSDLFTRSVTAKLRTATSRRVDFTAFDAQTRFARVLAYLADHYGTSTPAGRLIASGVTQRELATLAAVDITTVERALRKWRREGTIAPGGYRQLAIVRLDRLRAAAGGEAENHPDPGFASKAVI